MSTERVSGFLSSFAGWASAQPDIVAVILVGSHARNAARADSDIDLVVICRKPGEYLADLGWTHRFGKVERLQREDYGKVKSVRVWYGDGLEVEYGITDESWAALPLDEGTREVILNGARVLFERQDILSRHPEIQRARAASTGPS